MAPRSLSPATTPSLPPSSPAAACECSPASSATPSSPRPCGSATTGKAPRRWRSARGDVSALGTYDLQGRLHGGSYDDMAEQACRAYLAEYLTGTNILLTACERRECADLSRRIQGYLLDWGHLQPGRTVQLRDDARAYVGDLIIARQSDNQLPAGETGRTLANGDLLRVDAISAHEVTSERDPITILAPVVRRDDTQLSATETREHALSNADHLGALYAIWHDHCRAEFTARYTSAIREAATAADADEILKDTDALWRTVPAAELAGLDGGQVIRQGIEGRSFTGARSYSAVLDARIRKNVGDLPPKIRKSWAATVQKITDPDLAKYMPRSQLRWTTGNAASASTPQPNARSGPPARSARCPPTPRLAPTGNARPASSAPTARRSVTTTPATLISSFTDHLQACTDQVARVGSVPVIRSCEPMPITAAPFLASFIGAAILLLPELIVLEIPGIVRIERQVKEQAQRQEEIIRLIQNVNMSQRPCPDS